MPLTEQQKEYKKEYYENNKEKSKEYYEKNKEKIKEQKKKYRQEHKEQIKEYNKKYNEENREEKREYNKKYNEKNKEHIKEYYQTANGKKIKRISFWKSKGVISDDFDVLYEKYINTNECEICNVAIISGTGIIGKKHLDHCHISGKFRNILCGNCNVNVMRNK